MDKHSLNQNQSDATMIHLLCPAQGKWGPTALAPTTHHLREKGEAKKSLLQLLSSQVGIQEHSLGLAAPKVIH